MAEEGAGNGAAAETPAEPGKDQTRNYSITQKATINLAGDPAEVIAALIKQFGGDSAPSELEALVVVAKAHESTPKKALTTAAELRDLNGTYGVFADSAVTEFPVSVKTEKKVSVG